MSSKPQWYERGRNGPFEGEPFDAGMRQQVRQRIKKRHEISSGKRRMPVYMLSAAAVVLLVVGLWISFLDKSPITSPTDSSAIGSGGGQDGQQQLQPVIRAEGAADNGRLLIVPDGEETQDVLGAPSCYGLETDISFKGNYRVVYETHGKQNTIAALADLNFIQPSAGTAALTRLQFPEADVFLLIPQYRDCHGISFYAYAVAKDGGEAFPLTFSTDGTQSDTSYYAPDQAPGVDDGRLVLPSTEGPGGETAEGPQDRIFTLDLTARSFVQIRDQTGQPTGGS
ncbi:hypothetical protein [Paenibacillus nasutitermitis]|uniref:Uncharacterized protein n=1 Tax=Paenibacillus nasutitermitis TaxID=1652958 RepID=A0A916ZBL1_9BACL|nr:hypothetical protein [Paenibacillus nasutitermitis]GGD85873.1 hypothetical protein GCM10010911_50370 [Paenibacillus nasutitermitis]